MEPVRNEENILSRLPCARRAAPDAGRAWWLAALVALLALLSAGCGGAAAESARPITNGVIQLASPIVKDGTRPALVKMTYGIDVVPVYWVTNIYSYRTRTVYDPEPVQLVLWWYVDVPAGLHKLHCEVKTTEPTPLWHAVNNYSPLEIAGPIKVLFASFWNLTNPPLMRHRFEKVS